MTGGKSRTIAKWLPVATMLLLSLGRCHAQIGGALNKIQLIDNGYGNILIAIENSVPEDPLLLQRIEEHFTASSRDLFTATRGRTYFRNFTTLVPGSWKLGTYEDAGTETYSLANIVLHADGSRGYPWVRQYEDCGIGGEKMFLYYVYMLTATDQLSGNAVNFPHGKTLVHEWGHLRYGVYDEYPVSRSDAQFYLDGNQKSRPVGCVRDIKGETRGRCVRNQTTLLPDAECKFFPDKDNPGPDVRASLMYNMAVNSITEFCDNDATNPSTFHNDEAPNRQNNYCLGKSNWEVMRELPDFKNGANPSLDLDEPPSVPQFKVVRATAQRIVLILDVSGSMGQMNKLDRLRQDATFFLKEVIPVDSHVGIVTFNTSASIERAITLVDGPDSRDSLVRALPDSASGSTCISCGLKIGMQVLEDAGSTAGARFILLTDGIENMNLYAIDHLPDIKAKGITIDAFLYTKAPDSTLIELAEGTGGLAFYDSGTVESTATLNGFIATVAQRQQPDSVWTPSQLALRSVEIEAQDEVHLTVAVDSTVGNATRFSFTHSAGTPPSFNVAVISPSGVNFSSSGPEATHMLHIGIVSITIPGTAEAGTWGITIKNNESSKATTQMLVVSHPAVAGVASYMVTATVKHRNFTFSSTESAKPVVIYAEVKQHHTPVIKADVMAVIAFDSQTLRLPLRDNGVASDLFADDGIYSAFFTQFLGNGKYSVLVEVSSSNDTTTYEGGTGSPAPGQAATDNSTNVPEAFQRSTSPGFISSDNLPDPIPDLFPPARVNDLAVSRIDYDEKVISLRWTAVGDDLDHGQASKYEIRMSYSPYKLRFNFENCSIVEEQQIVNGSLSIVQPSLSEEIFLVNMSNLKENTTLFLALRVWDEADRVSQVSNLVSVAFPLVNDTGTTTQIDEPTTRTPLTTTMQDENPTTETDTDILTVITTDEFRPMSTTEDVSTTELSPSTTRENVSTITDTDFSTTDKLLSTERTTTGIFTTEELKSTAEESAVELSLSSTMENEGVSTDTTAGTVTTGDLLSTTEPPERTTAWKEERSTEAANHANTKDEAISTTVTVSIAISCLIASVVIVAAVVLLVYRWHTRGSNSHGKREHEDNYQSSVWETESAFTRVGRWDPACNRPLHYSSERLYHGSGQSVVSFPNTWHWDQNVHT